MTERTFDPRLARVVTIETVLDGKCPKQVRCVVTRSIFATTRAHARRLRQEKLDGLNYDRVKSRVVDDRSWKVGDPDPDPANDVDVS